MFDTREVVLDSKTRARLEKVSSGLDKLTGADLVGPDHAQSCDKVLKWLQNDFAVLRKPTSPETTTTEPADLKEATFGQRISLYDALSEIAPTLAKDVLALPKLIESISFADPKAQMAWLDTVARTPVMKPVLPVLNGPQTLIVPTRVNLALLGCLLFFVRVQKPSLRADSFTAPDNFGPSRPGPGATKADLHAAARAGDFNAPRFWDSQMKDSTYHKVRALIGYLYYSISYQVNSSPLVIEFLRLPADITWHRLLNQDRDTSGLPGESSQEGVPSDQSSPGTRLRDLMDVCEPLGPVEFMNGGIVDVEDAWHVDFADPFVGGRFLRDGCVQEEIMFAESPNVICSMAFCAELNQTDAVRISNACRCIIHTGYANDWKVLKVLEPDEWKIHKIMVIDAQPFGRFTDPTAQLKEHFMLREIKKFMAGCHGLSKGTRIATGNWGCGCFGGDVLLKFCLQWLAASVCGMRMCYVPWEAKIDDLLKTAYGGDRFGFKGMSGMSIRDLASLLLSLTSTTRLPLTIQILQKHIPKLE